MPQSFAGVPDPSQQVPLVDTNRRPGAKPIDSKKFRGGLQRLHRYRLAVQLEGKPVPTSFDSSAPFIAPGEYQQSLSTASQSNPHDDSQSSIGTSITDYTAVFSAENGLEQPEPERKGLAQVMKARKALLRYLGACEEGCRDRKVKCFLSHHSLEDMLDGQHSIADNENVKWALEVDYDRRQAPIMHTFSENLDASVATLVPPMADESVIERANRMLDLQSTPDALYPQRIEDPDDAFLGQNPLDLYEEEADFSYSVEKTPRTFPLGARINSYEGGLLIFRHYQCLWMGCCEHTYQSHEDLQLHYANSHTNFTRLQPDPLRLVCPTCFTFYPGPEGLCTNQLCHSPMMLLENVCGEFLEDTRESVYSSGVGVISLPRDATDRSHDFGEHTQFQYWQEIQNSTFSKQDSNGGSHFYNFSSGQDHFEGQMSLQSSNNNFFQCRTIQQNGRPAILPCGAIKATPVEKRSDANVAVRQLRHSTSPIPEQRYPVSFAYAPPPKTAKHILLALVSRQRMVTSCSRKVYEAVNRFLDICCWLVMHDKESHGIAPKLIV